MFLTVVKPTVRNFFDLTLAYLGTFFTSLITVLSLDLARFHKDRNIELLVGYLRMITVAICITHNRVHFCHQKLIVFFTLVFHFLGNCSVMCFVLKYRFTF